MLSNLHIYSFNSLREGPIRFPSCMRAPLEIESFPSSAVCLVSYTYILIYSKRIILHHLIPRDLQHHLASLAEERQYNLHLALFYSDLIVLLTR